VATNPQYNDPDTQDTFHSEDARIVGQMASGDQQAILQIYDRYSSLVYALAFHVLRDPQDSEDVCQEVFLGLWRAPEKYDPKRGSLATWMTINSRHRAIDYLRARRKHAPEGDSETELTAPGPGPDAFADMGRVSALISQLPLPQRQVLELSYFHGLTHAEIAAQTAQPLGTAKSRLRLALRNLRDLVFRVPRTRGNATVIQNGSSNRRA